MISKLDHPIRKPHLETTNPEVKYKWCFEKLTIENFSHDQSGAEHFESLDSVNKNFSVTTKTFITSVFCFIEDIEQKEGLKIDNRLLRCIHVNESNPDES